MTAEQKLQAVIGAQVKGGMKYTGVGPFWRLDGQSAHFHAVFLETDGREIPYVMHVLPILLDPVGLTAVWPEFTKDVDYGGHDYDEDGQCQHCNQISGYADEPCTYKKIKPAIFKPWRDAAFRILDSWLSGGAEAAINTAHSLLP